MTSWMRNAITSLYNVVSAPVAASREAVTSRLQSVITHIYEENVDKGYTYFWDVPNQFKTQEMCERAVEKAPWCLVYVPDEFKTREMCSRAVDQYPWCLPFVSDHLKTEEMCLKAVDQFVLCFQDIPDQFKSQEMCLKAVKKYPWCLKYVPDWFVTKEMCEKESFCLEYVSYQAEMWSEVGCVLPDSFKKALYQKLISEIENIIEDWKERKD